MKEIKIYGMEMCCETNNNHEYVWVKTILERLKRRGVQVECHKITEKTEHSGKGVRHEDFLTAYEKNDFPVIMVDGSIVMTGRYPTNAEFSDWLNISPFPWHGSNCLYDDSPYGDEKDTIDAIKENIVIEGCK